MIQLPEVDPGFSTPAMSATWSAAARVRRMCEVEAALAIACARAGLVPEGAARSIRAACEAGVADPAALLDEGWSAGTPVVPLLARLRARLGAGDAAFLHLGATTQDVVDTAAMLQLRDSLSELEALLRGLAEGLAALVERHPRDLTMARTLLQPARPVRFAFRVARWLDPVLSHLEDAAREKAALPIQLGGPVGDLAEYGGAAGAVAGFFADELRLAVPPAPWHTDRRPIAATLSSVERIAGTAASIAEGLLLLSQPEIGEVALPAGGSSSMPHKRNAIGPIRALAAARACHGAASVVAAAHPHELERAAGSWHAEWFAVPLVLQTAAAAVAATSGAVAGATFDAARAAQGVGGARLPDVGSADAFVRRVVERWRRGRS